MVALENMDVDVSVHLNRARQGSVLVEGIYLP